MPPNSTKPTRQFKLNFETGNRPKRTEEAIKNAKAKNGCDVDDGGGPMTNDGFHQIGTRKEA